MKDFELKNSHNAKHKYLEIERKKKLIAQLKCIIKENQNMISYEIKQVGRTFPIDQNFHLNEYLPKALASYGYKIKWRKFINTKFRV